MPRITSTAGALLRITAPCSLVGVREAARRLRSFLEQQGLSPEELDAWELAGAEAGNNAVEHATDEGAQLPVEFVVEVLPTTVEVRILDHTPGFDLPENPELPDPLSEDGRGLFLIRTLTDSLRYLRCPRGNTLEMSRRRLLRPERPPPPDADHAEMEATLGTMTEELAATYESLVAIFRFTEELSRAPVDRPFIERWLGQLCQICEASWAVLRVVSDSGDTLELAASHAGGEPLEPLTLAEPEAIAGSAELTALFGHRDIWLGTQTPVNPTEPLAKFGTEQSALVYPLRVGDVAVGVLSCGRLGDRTFPNAGQANIIRTFGDFLGIQLRNARIQEDNLRARLMTRELEIAANIQRSLLPVQLPQPPGMALAGLCESANRVGGDFYDVIEVAPRGLLLVIADVMGKGVPAAMFAAILRSQIRGRTDLAPTPGAFLAHLNRAMHPDLDRVDMFVTAQLVFVDLAARRLRTASAGHCPLLVARPGERLQEVPAGGPPLGIDPAAAYPETEGTLPEGTRVLMFTDGLIEARNPRGEFFGLGPTQAWLQSGWPREASATSAAADLHRQIRTFQGTEAPSDDLTFLLLTTRTAGATPAT